MSDRIQQVQFVKVDQGAARGGVQHIVCSEPCSAGSPALAVATTMRPVRCAVKAARCCR